MIIKVTLKQDTPILREKESVVEVFGVEVRRGAKVTLEGRYKKTCNNHPRVVWKIIAIESEKITQPWYLLESQLPK